MGYNSRARVHVCVCEIFWIEDATERKKGGGLECCAYLNSLAVGVQVCGQLLPQAQVSFDLVARLSLLQLMDCP